MKLGRKNMSEYNPENDFDLMALIDCCLEDKTSESLRKKPRQGSREYKELEQKKIENAGPLFDYMVDQQLDYKHMFSIVNAIKGKYLNGITHWINQLREEKLEEERQIHYQLEVLRGELKKNNETLTSYENQVKYYHNRVKATQTIGDELEQKIKDLEAKM